MNQSRYNAFLSAACMPTDSTQEEWRWRLHDLLSTKVGMHGCIMPSADLQAVNVRCQQMETNLMRALMSDPGQAGHLPGRGAARGGAVACRRH